ncbi:copper resistance protein CopC, partial [uncultured Amnibacterium sp.]|uniref:copper resistance CopC/CopD family protein n=1 Tax=uncultured Amnibacterium sp. TaxID=1631851 RepID=UPI0035CB83C4
MSGSAVAGRAARWLRLLPLLLLALTALLLLPSTPASAHAVLVSSDPADGARVAASPAEVRLVFDEAVGLPPAATAVLSSTGERGQRGAARLADGGTTVVVPLRADLPTGVWNVSFRLVSADSHVITGSIRFGVRQDADAVESAAGTGSPLDAAVGAATGFAYLGLALGVGVPAAAALLWPSVRSRRRVVRVTAAGLAVVLLATVAELLIRGPRASGDDLSGVLRFDGLGYLLTSTIGTVLLARLVLVVALAVLLRRPAEAGRGRTAAAGVVGLGLLMTVALLGHATDGAWWLLVPAAVVHLAAMVLWLGGLVVLAAAVLPRTARTPEAGLRSLRRWSVVAFCCIAVLVVTGEVQAFPTVAPLDSLWST